MGHINNKTNHSKVPSAAPAVLQSGTDVDVAGKFNLDRYLGDVLTLPYTFNEIKIKSNELGVHDNINASLYKLYYNFLYLNAQTKIASNNFPVNYKGFIASNSSTAPNNVSWYASTQSSESVMTQLQNTTGTVLSGLVDGAFTRGLDESGDYVGFVANPATLIAVQSNIADDTVSIRLNTKTVEDATALSFTNIKSLAIDSQKRLFVCDGTNIYKMDVDAILTVNPAITAVGRFLIKNIGGKSSSIHDKDKFNNPVSIRINNNDRLYILDRGDKGYKIFDSNLNWVDTASKSIDFDALPGSVVDIAPDPASNNVFILSEDGNVLEYNESQVLVNKYTFTDTLQAGEKFKRLSFSSSDNNVVYILSNKNIYKKFKSKLHRSIGVFRISDNNIVNERFTFVDVVSLSSASTDNVFVGGESTYANVPSDIGKIFKFDEQISYQTIAYDSYKSYTYPMSSISIDGDEYITSLVVNKALSKLLYNHLIFRDNLHSKYSGTYDSTGRLQYNGVSYIKDTDTNLFEYEPVLNNYVGLNEPVLAATINRPLNEVYKIQKTLLDMCKERYTNKYPYATQTVVI